MAIEKPNVVDAVGIDKATSEVILTVADFLDWESSETQHLLMLQEKLCAYVRFVESRQLLEEYPAAKGKRPVICIIGRCEPSATALRFFATTRTSLGTAGIDLRFQLHTGDSEH